MRIDFREERKWKIALAHNLAHAVMAWHSAGSKAEREPQTHEFPGSFFRNSLAYLFEHIIPG